MKIGNKYIPISRETYEKAAKQQLKRIGITDSGEANAFKHAFSSALIARDWGEHAANFFGTINELRPNNPTGEWSMDRHNNVSGIQTIKNRQTEISDEELADEIKRRIDRGQLILSPQETGYSEDKVGLPPKKTEDEIHKDAVARMRNTGRGLTPNTPVSAEPQSTEQLMQEERMKFPLDSSRRREAVKKMKLFGRDDGNK